MNENSSSTPVLSKSRILTGLRCHKALWWTTHEPDAPELRPTSVLEDRFDQGRQVGELARTYVVGGTVIGEQFLKLEERLERTQRAIDGGATVLYEAAFAADDGYVQIDILERLAEGWRLIEVKDSSSVKAKHIADVAVQLHVARRAGLDVRQLQLMHLNKNCYFPKLDNLFLRADVTADVFALAGTLPVPIARATDSVTGILPDTPVGDHCWKPNACPFVPRCHPATPPGHVDTLYNLRAKKRKALADIGVEAITEIPADFDLSEIQTRQRKGLKAGDLVVEPSLAAALAPLREPLAFLDFETISRAIPVWDKCAPWQQVPAQFSCHIQESDRTVRHREWLADGSGDPRRPLAEALIEACGDATAVLAYYVQFEKSRIEELAWLFTDLKVQLYGIADKLVDLLPIVRENVYHPAFAGSFGLKAVAPALVGINYEELEIKSGGEATLGIARLLMTTDEITGAERTQLREQLLEYCKQDTLCLVKILNRLRELAA